MSVLVRRAVRADGDHLLRLARAFHAEDSHPLSELGAAALLAMLEPEFGDGLVSLLVVEGAHCGYGSLTFGYSVAYGGRDAFIDDFYVTPAARACGYGDLLCETLERAARDAGCRAVHLEIMPGN